MLYLVLFVAVYFFMAGVVDRVHDRAKGEFNFEDLGTEETLKVLGLN